MNPIDWVVSQFSPVAGVKRSLARKALRQFEAGTRGRRTSGWHTTAGDADSNNQRGQALVRQRARDLRQNNPFAERGISAIASNMVGYGIVPDPQGRARMKRRALAMWKQWAETTACDFDGLCNIYGLQHLAAQAVPESGAVFLHRVWTPGQNLMNFQIKLLEMDYLDQEKNWANADGSYVVQGIQYNAAGRRQGYWMFPQHPGGQVRSISASLASVLVPAEDIAHVFLRKRPGQTNGYSWLAPVMLGMRNYDEMSDALIEQAKVAACFAAIIQSDDVSGGPGTQAPALIERLEPGMIERVGAGEAVTFGNPPTFNGYDSYSKQSLRATSVGLGIPYEVLTGDLNGVSFTSGRMGWLEFGRNIDIWRWHMLVPQMCEVVWRWFNEAAAVMPGGWEEPVACGWVAPRRDLIDPTKELDALKAEMRIGALSYTGMLKERGINDTAAHIQQIEEDNAALDAAGIVLDSDPRNLSQQGQVQASQAPTTTDGTDAATLGANSEAT